MVSPVDDDGVVVFDDMGDVEGAVVGVEADELEALRGVAFEEIDFLVVGLEGRVVDVMAVGWSAGPVAGGAVGFADEHAGGGDVAVDDVVHAAQPVAFAPVVLFDALRRDEEGVAGRAAFAAEQGDFGCGAAGGGDAEGVARRDEKGCCGAAEDVGA